MKDIELSIIGAANGISENFDFIETIATWNDNMNALVEEYGEESVDITLTVLQLKAGWNVMLGLFLLLITLVLSKSISRQISKLDPNTYPPGKLFLSWIIVIPAAIVGIVHLFNFNTWVTVINPKFGLVWMFTSKFVN